MKRKPSLIVNLADIILYNNIYLIYVASAFNNEYFLYYFRLSRDHSELVSARSALQSVSVDQEH